MQWSEKHDTLLMREILLFEPWEQRYGSPERGLVWKQIADSLTSYEEAKFKILDSRSVRDRYKALVKKYKKKKVKSCVQVESAQNTQNWMMPSIMLSSVLMKLINFTNKQPNTKRKNLNKRQLKLQK